MREEERVAIVVALMGYAKRAIKNQFVYKRKLQNYTSMNYFCECAWAKSLSEARGIASCRLTTHTYSYVMVVPFHSFAMLYVNIDKVFLELLLLCIDL